MAGVNPELLEVVLGDCPPQGTGGFLQGYGFQAVSHGAPGLLRRGHRGWGGWEEGRALGSHPAWPQKPLSLLSDVHGSCAQWPVVPSQHGLQLPQTSGANMQTKEKPCALADCRVDKW